MNRLRTRLRASIADGPLVLLDFISGGLDPRVTFSRGSNATLVDSTGKITYAPANLVSYSQEFDNASWTKTATTVTANATTAPDGTTTADKLIETTAASTQHFARTTAATLNITYAFSAYIKAGERTRAVIAMSDLSTGDASIGVNLLTGATFASGLAVGSWTNIASAVVALENGWYRVSITATRGGSGSSTATTIYTDNGSSITYTGDGTSGIFLWGAQLEPVTYQTTPSTYNATTSAAYYGPRFDYDPVTLAAKGLLIEEARTNLVTYSEQLDNAAWVKSQVTVAANATLAPNGLLVADKIIENTAATTYHAIYPGTSPTGSVTGSYTFTVYAKAAERRYISLDMNSYLDGVVFDLQNGAVTGTSTFYTSSITPAGNGWYRCSVSKNYTVATVLYAEAIISTSATVPNAYTGDGTSGIFIWGAQVEAGAFATSYIPTVASTVTRSADVATMTGTNFSSWYNQSEGTFVASADTLKPPSVSAVNFIFIASDGTQNERAQNAFDTSNVAAGVVDGNASQANFTNAYTLNQVVNTAIAYKVNDFAASFNGSAATTDTSGTIPTVNRMTLGSSWDGANFFLNGHIRQIAYYNTRLPNTQLQTLTAPSLATTLSLSFTNQAYTVGV